MKISRDWVADYIDLQGLSDQEIADRLTEIGHAVESVETHGQDTVFEIEFTTNRVDAMSHQGIARELAAGFGRPLLDRPNPDLDFTPADVFPVTIEAPELCTRYSSLIIRGVTIKPSSLGIRTRLEAVGLRLINNVVDVTNYLMMATGHPLHAFDLDRLHEQIIVRPGRPGEKFRSLDGVDRLLDADTTVIADARRAVAIGGIIGGENSEVHENSRNILLECAHFNPSAIRRTARRLGVLTDAAYRFERGVDPGNGPAVIAEAGNLIAREAGGKPGELGDVVASKIEQPAVILRAERLSAATGGVIGIAYALELFRRLQMDSRGVPDGVEVRIPSFRVDLSEEADLIEEVERFFGYNNIPAALPRVPTGDVRHDPVRDAEDEVRDILVGCGLAEVVTYSFVPREDQERFTSERPIAITNALTEQIGSMRTTILPGLLRVAAFNRSYGNRDGALFEVGRTYHPSGQAVEERNRASILLFGVAGSRWGEPRRPYDYFDLKGIIEAIAGRKHVELTFHPESRPWLQPGQGAVARSGGREIAILGALAREVLQAFEIKGDVFAAEINLRPFLESAESWKMRPVSRFPGVPMVLQMTHAPDLPYSRVVEAVRKLNLPYLQEVGIRDRYVRPDSNEVKTTLGVWYQSHERSLTQEEVGEIHGRLIEKLASQLPVKIVKSE